MSIKINDIIIRDIRFPTSKSFDGSDAMNVDPDYSAAHVTLKTNKLGLEGYGLTFTIGRGNEVCVAAIEALSYLVKGLTLEEIITDMGKFAGYMESDSQLAWLGPQKGLIHIASAAIINAVWDLWARLEKKPLWKLVTDLPAKEIVKCVDFKNITDVITSEEAVEMLTRLSSTKDQRIKKLIEEGYPAYSTSAGWLGYDDKKLSEISKNLMIEGWKAIKIKVGKNLQDDLRRIKIVRNIIGPNKKIMIDANQVWSVNQAIEYLNHFKEFNIHWIEEPTHPDDIIGHSKIRESVNPMKIATGEHCHNKIMFKQLMQSKAIDFCQIDSCRLAGFNENLAVMIMASKFNIPVCPHAGGVGLCEYVQHLSMIDFIAISGSMNNRMTEYVDCLRDYFTNPAKIKNGRYVIPYNDGYTVQMKESTLEDYSFPTGSIWKQSYEF